MIIWQDPSPVQSPSILTDNIDEWGWNMVQINFDEKEAKNLLKQNVLFEKASEFALNYLVKKISCYKYKKGDPIFLSKEAGENVYLVKSGRVEIVRADDGGKDQTQLVVLTSGSQFSEFSVLCNNPHSNSAFSLDNAEVFHVPKDVFIEVVRENIDVTRALVTYISRQLQKTLNSS